jgi:hypothetical protein
MDRVKIPFLSYTLFVGENGYLFIYLFKNEGKCSHFELRGKKNTEIKHNVKMQESKCLIHLLTRINRLMSETLNVS